MDVTKATDTRTLKRDLLHLFITNILRTTWFSATLLPYGIIVVTFIWKWFPTELLSCSVLRRRSSSKSKNCYLFPATFCMTMNFGRFHRRRTFYFILYYDMLICLYIIPVIFRITYHVIFKRRGNVTYFKVIF